MSLDTKTIIIKVTNDCNFNCNYCFIDKNAPKHKIITKEIIQRLFEQLQSNLNLKEITTTWHGGNPF